MLGWGSCCVIGKNLRRFGLGEARRSGESRALEELRILDIISVSARELRKTGVAPWTRLVGATVKI